MNTELKGRMGFLKGVRQLAILFIFLLPLVLMSCGDLKDKLLSTDTTAPTNTTASNFIDSGALSTSSTTVTLAISATDSVGITGYYASETSTTPSASATGWTSITSATSYSASVSFTLSSGDETKTVYVWFKDAAGNVSASASDSITLAATLSSKLLGTWGETTLQHNNDGTWDTEVVTFTYSSDNTGTATGGQFNYGGTLETASPDTFTYSVVSNSDGSLTTNKIFSDGTSKTHRWVIGDDGNVMILDGTTQSNKQRLRVAVKLDTAKTYTNADLSGDYYIERYRYDGSYAARSTFSTFDGAGNRSYTLTTNTDGVISTATSSASGPYSVSSDGSYTVDNGANTGYLLGNGMFSINTHVNDPATWSLALSMKKADKTYSTADLAGTWAYSSFGDNDGASFRAVFGAMTCNSSGSCSFSEKIQEDGSISYQSGTHTFSVASDGSITDANKPSRISAIGNNGNTIISNNSFDQSIPGRRRIGIDVKCSTCSDLAAVPQYTAGGTYTYNSTTGVQTSNWTSSNFTCDGPSAGDTNTKTGVTITSTTMTYDGGDIWTRSSGTAGDIVGTWTFTNSTTGNSFTMTYNADLTVSLVGNIVSCGIGSTSSAPTGVSVTAGDASNTLSWSNVADATSYNIYWSTTTGVTKAGGTKISSATSPYTHATLTNDTTYYYVVTAVNSSGESVESAQASAMPSLFNGTYTGSWSKTCIGCGVTAGAGTFTITVANGVLSNMIETIASGGDGSGIKFDSGTVSSSGAITGTGATPSQCSSSVSTFTGQITITLSGGAEMTMTYSRTASPEGCAAESGTMTATRQ